MHTGSSSGAVHVRIRMFSLPRRVAVSTSRQDDVAASAAGTAPFNRLGEETTYYREEKVAPNQGFILVDTYGGQQGSGVESLVSLQVIARFQY